MMVMKTFVQLAVIAIWSAMLAWNTRRLLRLAHVEARNPLWNTQIRQKLSRVWWWLGREEFWRNVQADALQCMQLTLMFFLFAWNI